MARIPLLVSMLFRVVGRSDQAQGGGGVGCSDRALNGRLVAVGSLHNLTNVGGSARLTGGRARFTVHVQKTTNFI